MRGSASMSQIPVIVYTGRELTKKQETELRRVAETIIIKDVKSLDRLLEDMHQSDAVLKGRKVLVVDDDIRNIFALTSVLEEHDMNVISAGNGRDALRIMATEAPIDLVLMDIMMPEMDGMATMREARKLPSCRDLPIIAVTAKAMKGDRERCIEAGAWDYLSKPVDPHHMLAVMRSWLYR
jgi:CheY-like chemotaxis protein